MGVPHGRFVITQLPRPFHQDAVQDGHIQLQEGGRFAAVHGLGTRVRVRFRYDRAVHTVGHDDREAAGARVETQQGVIEVGYLGDREERACLAGCIGEAQIRNDAVNRVNLGPVGGAVDEKGQTSIPRTRTVSPVPALGQLPVGGVAVMAVRDKSPPL